MKKLIAHCALTAGVLLAGAARADSSIQPDYSDLWFNPTESGWGAHATLQDDIVFLVLFVYDAQRQPRFFVASDMRRSAAGQPFAGALYSTTGPAFAGPFDPAQVAVRSVGNASLAFDTAGTATLSYSVDGISVTKSIQRQSWRVPDLTGDYKGGMFASSTACPSGLPKVSYPGSVKISQSGDLVTIDSTFEPGFSEQGTCRWIGRLSQLGTVVSITEGTYACDFFNSNTASGTFALTGIEANESGFGGRYSAHEGTGSCTHSGYLGGMRRGYSDSPPSAPSPE